jgi:hypothetical protein
LGVGDDSADTVAVKGGNAMVAVRVTVGVAVSTVVADGDGLAVAINMTVPVAV